MFNHTTWALNTDSEIASRSWIAICLSLFAGLATALGGCIVYFKRLVKLANKTFLSAALGFSAGISSIMCFISEGVMLFLSFAEIFVESKNHFLIVTKNTHFAMLYACLSLFSGIFTAFILDYILHRGSDVEFELPQGTEESVGQNVHTTELPKRVSGAVVQNKVKASELTLRHRQSEGEIVHNPIMSDNENKCIVDNTSEDTLVIQMPKNGYEVKTISGNTRDLSKSDYFVESAVQSEMKTVGLMSAIAIALHNIPEGIVTYVGYIDNPAVGISLAIGIATHNIPEGLSVALPVYYATKSRNKAFLWSLLSGLAEPLGAFLCMLFLNRFMNDYIFGFLFGFTGGIMTHISVFELLPTGIKMDCDKNYTVNSFIVGIGFIMISLILF